MTRTPPAEWAPQRALFTAFPSHEDLWEEDLAPAQAEMAAMVRQLAETVPVKLLADGAEAVAAAEAAVGGKAEVFDIAFGDIWLRDTGPIFTSADTAVRFRFNGWGGKYDLPGDDTVGAHVAGLMSAAVDAVDAILEGGAIEYDGAGLILTTEQCLLNPNRNPGWTKAEAERVLGAALGARRVVWLGDGLLNDHTDGHVDNLARFVGAGTVALPEAWTLDDPNTEVFAEAAERLRAAGLAVVGIPSVGAYEMDGELVPASHMNWIVANGQVVVPLYGGPSDAKALEAVRRCFPRHKVTGLAANHILTGGGSFHCITQQVPA
ncbi:agmatine deiminase family protein [Sandaracinobacter sp. RS1-74]|uniref:agmatine deiminase family protein n=1 Tax=Sandaracinobacteroides sayramensis TaxID=2913411 RepID=UPI001EDA1FD1|nr:agmatine deiminase family protein [Sandaracinobacteroides sayramensis]MCG2839841.1 agmatine deiminase family protein [Sandaracinobacteroides sayramensis]